MVKLILYFYISGFQMTYEPFDSMAECTRFASLLNVKMIEEFKAQKAPAKYVMKCFHIPEQIKGHTS